MDDLNLQTRKPRSCCGEQGASLAPEGAAVLVQEQVAVLARERAVLTNRAVALCSDPGFIVAGESPSHSVGDLHILIAGLERVVKPSRILHSLIHKAEAFSIRVAGYNADEVGR